MLKIDGTKNLSTPSVGRSKLNANSGENSSTADNSYDESSVETSDFARVLESLSKEAKSDRQVSDQSKEVDKKADKYEEKNANKAAAENEPNQKSSDRAGNQSEAVAAANSRASAQESNVVETEQFVPPARSIMHVADLERIVSGFRTQLVDGNQQVVITLKNSVFNGLRIKLTTDENRRITAEFIASNEKIKAQLDLRANELSSLLRQRGVNINSLQTTVDSGSSENDSNQREAKDLAASLTPASRSSRNSIGAAGEETLSNEIESVPDSDDRRNLYRA